MSASSRRPLHRELWEDNHDLARACLDHPFVRGLADGSLTAEAFRVYVGQDAFFLRAFLGGYAVATARSERVETAMRFHRLQAGVLEELELHAGYAEELGIDLDGVLPLPTTSAYTDFLRATAWGHSLGETVAAMTPCMRLYAFLGQRLAAGEQPDDEPLDDGPYADWIDTYASDDFEVLATELEALLDELAEDESPIRSAYRYAMECELAFFSAPLEG